VKSISATFIHVENKFAKKTNKLWRQKSGSVIDL